MDFNSWKCICVPAKVQQAGEKPERPHREGARRQSVEHGLKEAAEKLSHMPVSEHFSQIPGMECLLFYFMNSCN